MPRETPNHTSHKESVCAFYHSGELFKCATKSKLILKEGDATCERIHKYVSTTYDPSKAKYPSGCCPAHKKALLVIDNEKDSKKKEELVSKLDPIVNPGDLDFTFQSDRLMETDVNCQCPYCKIVSSSWKTEGSTYGSKPEARGRPPLPAPTSNPSLPPRVSVPTCQRCGRQTGPGRNHPVNCNVGDLMQNVASKINQDQKLKDLITSANIKEKIAEARASTTAGAGPSGAAGGAPKGSVKIATGAPGKFLTVKTMTPKDVKKELFPPQTMSDTFQKLMVTGNSSQNQMKAVAKSIRATHGRKSVESNIMEKLSAANKELAGFFSVIQMDLDPCGGPEGSEGHSSLIPDKVKRDVAYCTNLDGLVEYVKRERGHHPQTKLMLKLGMDSGKAKYIRLAGKNHLDKIVSKLM